MRGSGNATLGAACGLVLLLGACAPQGPDPGDGAGGDPGPCFDADGDGFPAATCGGADCDDVDPAVNPLAEEVCANRLDDDCDGLYDEDCNCLPGDAKPCWPGAPADRGRGACRDGFERCSSEGVWGTCEQAVLPAAEGPTCDGIDRDCHGEDGEGCTRCAAASSEICGNGVDDDCNQVVDDPAFCYLTCDAPSDQPLPPWLSCCSDPAVNRYSGACVEAPGLAACVDRACVDLDDDPDTLCVKRCDSSECYCGREGQGGELIFVSTCGFETPCNRLDCDGRLLQPCYAGPAVTLGVGACHGGFSSCDDTVGGRQWGTCEGDQLPVQEVCGNHVDDDCDGFIDEDDGPTGHPCVRTDCLKTGALIEYCGDGVDGMDDDCDGLADEGCPAGQWSQECFTGPPAAARVGICHPGVQHAMADGFWGPCEGEQLPEPERCGDGIDSDCNGIGDHGADEPACCVPGEEICDGVDNDCDGLADDGVVGWCGVCGSDCGEVENVDAHGDCKVDDRVCEGLDDVDEQIRLVAGVHPASTALYLLRPPDSAFDPPGLNRIDAATGIVVWNLDAPTDPGDVIAANTDDTVWWLSSGPVDSLLYLVDSAGVVLCGWQVGGGEARLTSDPAGNAYLARRVGGNFVLARFDRTHMGPPGPLGLPTCEPDDLDPSSDETDRVLPSDYREIVAAPGVLWLAGTIVGRLAPPFYELQDRPLAAPAAMHPTANRAGVWIPEGAAMERVGPLGRVDGAIVETFDGAYARPTAGPDGSVWAQRDDELVRFGEGEAPVDVAPLSPGDRLVAVDGLGLPWVASGDLVRPGISTLRRLDAGGASWTTLPGDVMVGPGALASTWTAAASYDFSLRTGHWEHTIDSRSDRTRWDLLTWTEQVPALAQVRVGVRMAATRDALARATTCFATRAGELDLAGCARGKAARWLRIYIDLRSGVDTPWVSDIGLRYHRR